MDAVRRRYGVGAEILRVPVGCDDAAARFKGLVHAFDEVRRQQIVGVKDEKTVAGREFAGRTEPVDEKLHGVTLAGVRRVEPLIDDGAF